MFLFLDFTADMSLTLIGRHFFISKKIKSNKNISEIIVHEKNGILFHPETDLKLELKKYLSSESTFNKITTEGYDYIKNNNLIDFLLKKEIKIYKNL